MLQQQIAWAFVNTLVTVDTNAETEAAGLKLTVNLRTAEESSLGTEFDLDAVGVKGLKARAEALLEEPGVYGDAKCREAVNQVCYLDITLSADRPVVMPHTTIDFSLPIDNCPSLWLPSICTPCKNIRAKGMLEFNTGFSSHICNLAPMGAWYSAEGINKLSFALTECKDIVNVTIGAYEEAEVARCAFSLFDLPAPATTSYQVTLRFDTSCLPVFNAVSNITRFYERFLHTDIMPVPEAALEPVYSTWYAFLQNLEEQEIEEQCRLAAAVGCKTVIVDDGWQTDDNNRGYAFCGDWQVSTKRFPHFKEHVQRVHELGMKYMVWFAVPFIGSKCQHHEKYAPYCLCFAPRWNAYVLDPRYTQVRQFLVDTFTNMVKNYDLDGLKLDFIDEFDMRQADEHARAFDPERTTQSLPDAVEMLMTEIRQSLESVKSDILIEFRQNYVGPVIRKFGNMFRAHDCPNDSLMNRMTTTDVRALTGTDAKATAVHSDMTIWSPTESVESASLNFIHTLFSVPQISPNMKHLSAEHTAMVKHWLSFWHEHRDLLMHGKMYAAYPEFEYTLLGATLGAEELLMAAADHTLELFAHDEVKTLTLVNGAMKTKFVVKSATNATVPVKAVIYDCLGKQVGTQELSLSPQVQEIALPKSGYIVFTRA
ncbi:MAG: alpha-galactosidase [Candidatus Anaerobiospirillum pullicola]|uniref:Alpha-galactosidase n=1 Tax=Candidatus Anaerobiospirillum pullicola TaxID=2838451 RepID=A0A948WYG1_9GAMM|nr:alpha-galactosidase [Candidatus Anaerobiospirillum pullicola]